MRQGFLKIEDKYPCEWEVAQFSDKVAEVLEPHITCIDYEGQQIEITIDFKAMTVYCDEYYPHEDDEDYEMVA